MLQEVQEELVDIQLQDAEEDFDIDADLTARKRCRKPLQISS